MRVVLIALASWLALAQEDGDNVDHSYEDSPQAAFENANAEQMLMVVRVDPDGHVYDDEVDAMVFTTLEPKEAYSDLQDEADLMWEDIDEGHHLLFSYRITEPVPARIMIADDTSLWSAFVMASYLDIEVPVLYAQIATTSPTPAPTTAIPSNPPTPEPSESPTLSGTTIDGVEYKVSYGLHDWVWDNQWKGDRITIEDYGVSARMYTGNGHESTRATKCFSEGQHMWRLQLYTNDDQKTTNVEWMVIGVVNEGAYFDSHHKANRSCGVLAHSATNYCNNWGSIQAGAWKAMPDQETIEMLLDCDAGTLTWRLFDTQDSFVTYGVPQCNETDQCLYPWLEMHYGDRHNSGTVLGEPVDTFHNVWDDSDYPIEYGLRWDEDWMGSRIRCEQDCKVARMHTGNGHQNTRTTVGWTEGKHAWRLKLYALDNEQNTNAEWLVPGITTEGDYFDSYNLSNRSCGILAHSVTNYCNWWGYVQEGANNQRIPSRQTIILMLDLDEGLLFYQFQGRPEPWVSFGVPADGTKVYPWCQMHYGDARQNACDLIGQMFEFENVNHHFETHSNNG